MMIIGLVGGKSANRAEIAARLVRMRECRLVALAPSVSRQPGARVSALSAALEKSERNRALAGVVITDVVTRAEADEIRRRGGVIWHVMGIPSDQIPIRLEDKLVTHMQGGCRHYLDAIEALSELLLQAVQAH